MVKKNNYYFIVIKTLIKLVRVIVKIQLSVFRINASLFRAIF